MQDLTRYRFQPWYIKIYREIFYNIKYFFIYLYAFLRFIFTFGKDRYLLILQIDKYHTEEFRKKVKEFVNNVKKYDYFCYMLIIVRGSRDEEMKKSPTIEEWTDLIQKSLDNERVLK